MTDTTTAPEIAPGINLRLHAAPGGGATFIEIEDDHARSVKVGTVAHGEDGAWSIRITAADIAALKDQPKPAQPRLLLGYTVPDHVRWSAFGRNVDLSCLTDTCRLNGTAKRFLVPALGDATEAIDWLKEHAHGAEVVEFRPASASGAHVAERTLTLPADWCDQLREVHKHELTGSDKIRAISQAISIISNWLLPAGGAR